MKQEDEAESVSSEQSLRGGVVPRYYILILVVQALMLAQGHVMTWYVMLRQGHGWTWTWLLSSHAPRLN